MKKINKRTAFTIVILEGILLSAIGVLFYMNGKKEKEKEDNDALVHNVVEEKPQKNEIPVNFDELQKINPDIYAWVKIDGTEVDAPILQNMESNELYDEYYLDHLYNKVKGFSGSLFTQKINTTTFEDSNTIIYGHNMKNLEAFGCLKNYREQEYFDNHKTINIYTPDHIFEYEIFAAVDFSDEHLMVKYNFANPSEVQNFINDVRESQGIVDTNINVSAEDKLLTLSTCTSSNSTRYLIVAKLVDAK